MSASWFWGSVPCCLNAWIWQWHKNCSARWLSCCLPGISSFSFASSKACPDCSRTLKKEGLLHTLQSLCSHPNRQRHLVQLWQAAGPCWWTPWAGQAECCRTCSPSLPLGGQCRGAGDELLRGCSSTPTQQRGDKGEGPLLNRAEMQWRQSLVSGWQVEQGGRAGSTDCEEGGTGEVIALQGQSLPLLAQGTLCPSHRWVAQSGTYSVCRAMHSHWGTIIQTTIYLEEELSVQLSIWCTSPKEPWNKELNYTGVGWKTEVRRGTSVQSDVSKGRKRWGVGHWSSNGDNDNVLLKNKIEELDWAALPLSPPVFFSFLLCTY